MEEQKIQIWEIVTDDTTYSVPSKGIEMDDQVFGHCMEIINHAKSYNPELDPERVISVKIVSAIDLNM